MAIVEVGREDEVPPGTAIRVWVNDEPVGIYNVDGELFAIGDTCTHEDFSLTDGGLIEDHTVECALHGSRFDLRSGAALSMPATGAVPTYPVWVENGVIKVEAPA
jgi:3-phenylpropionate/trans-cinnamate dioxygenase ferredoxin subunit